MAKFYLECGSWRDIVDRPTLKEAVTFSMNKILKMFTGDPESMVIIDVDNIPVLSDIFHAGQAGFPGGTEPSDTPIVFRLRREWNSDGTLSANLATDIIALDTLAILRETGLDQFYNYNRNKELPKDKENPFSPENDN